MKKWIVPITLILSLLDFSKTSAGLSHYNLFVVKGEDTPGKIYQLTILPNGEILDPNIQYPLSHSYRSLSLTWDNRFLLVCTYEYLDRFQVNSDGNLYLLGSTEIPEKFHDFTITPDDKIVIIPMFGEGTVFTLTTDGDIIDGIPGPQFGKPTMDFLGRGLIARSTLTTFSAYTINYTDRTLHEMTTYRQGLGSVSDYAFTHDGNLGFISGNYVHPDIPGQHLWVLKIENDFTVITTSQLFVVPGGNGITKPYITKDNQYLLTSAGNNGIALFAIDTAGILTDTGERYKKGSMGFFRVTPDEKMVIVYYEDPELPLPKGAIATGFINPDRSITWTDYRFAIESTYPTAGQVGNMVVVSVYVTGVEENQWQFYSEDYPMTIRQEMEMEE